MKLYKLRNRRNREVLSVQPGRVGGHKRLRIYGRLDCPSAARHVAAGRYVAHRVFFADDPTAQAAGYRPCARCMPDAYAAWKAGT